MWIAIGQSYSQLVATNRVTQHNHSTTATALRPIASDGMTLASTPYSPLGLQPNPGVNPPSQTHISGSQLLEPGRLRRLTEISRSVRMARVQSRTDSTSASRCIRPHTRSTPPLRGRCSEGGCLAVSPLLRCNTAVKARRTGGDTACAGWLSERTLGEASRPLAAR